MMFTKLNRRSLTMGKTVGILLLLLSLVAISPSVSARQAPQLEVELIKTEPVPLQTSEYADIWVKLRNKGNVKADNASLELVPTFPFNVDPDEVLKRNIGAVYPQAEYHARFQVRVDENAVQGTNDLKFKLSSGSDVSFTQKVPVEVRTDDAALLVKSMETTPRTISPSKTGKLTVTLENLADSYLKNIDLSLDLSSSTIPLITIGSTTRQRVQKLAPGETAQVNYQIKADADADPEAYKVTLSLDYENEAGSSFTESEQTGIIVGGKPQIEANLVESDIMQPGNSGKVSFSLVNRGLTVGKFVSLELQEGDGYEIISSPTIYIGNMDSDDYESATYNLYVNEGVDSLELPLEIYYKDSEGRKQLLQSKVDLQLYNQDEINRMNLLERDNTVAIVVIVIALLVVAYIGYRYWKARKRKALQ